MQLIAHRFKTSRMLGFVVALTINSMGLSLGYQTPVYVWPLSEYSYTNEVIADVTSDNYQCGLNFQGTYNMGAPVTPLVLDGNKYPYVDLNVGSAGITGDVCITLLVKPNVDLNGCIFEYLSNTNSGGITRLRVCLAGGQLNVVRTIAGNFEESVSISSGLSIGVWSLMCIGVNYNLGVFDIYVGSNHQTVGPSFQTSKTLGTPGRLRLGATFSAREANFAGAMTCVGLHRALVSSDEIASVLLNCVTTTDWNYYQFSGLDEHDISVRTSGHSSEMYINSARTSISSWCFNWLNAAVIWPNFDGCSLLQVTTEAAPLVIDRSLGLLFVTDGNDMSPKATSEAPFATMTVSTKLFCAWNCFSNDLCKSFTIVPSLTTDLTCSLFSEIHDNGDIEFNALTTYYKVDL